MTQYLLTLYQPDGPPPEDLDLDRIGAELGALNEELRSQGAWVFSGGADSLTYLEALKPDFAKIDNKLTAGIQYSAGRRRLVAALVECAHEYEARVVAEGVERVGEFEAMRDLGVDFGQGFYFGQPTERPMAVDPRLVRARPELV